MTLEWVLLSNIVKLQDFIYAILVKNGEFDFSFKCLQGQALFSELKMKKIFSLKHLVKYHDFIRMSLC